MDSWNLKSLSEYFLFFSASLALLFSIVHLLVRQKNPANVNLAGLLFCLSALLFQIGFLANGTAYSAPEVVAFHLTLIFFIGPLAYIAYYLVVFPAESLPFKKYVYFLPSVIALAGDGYYLQLSRAGKIEFLVELFGSAGPGTLWPMRAVYALAGFKILLYLGILLRDLVRHMRREGRRDVLVVNIMYIAVTIAGAETVIAGFIAGSRELMFWGAFSIGLLFVCSLLVGIRYPNLIQLIILEAKKSGELQTRLRDSDLGATVESIERHMKENKPYLNEELSLGELADALELTPHQLSRILNERLQTNFNNYVNRHRIQAACEMLEKEPARSVLSIAYAVGFNSKSSFYDAFTRFKNSSPKRFRSGALKKGRRPN